MVLKKSSNCDPLPNHEFILSFDSAKEANAFRDWLFTGPDKFNQKGGKKTFDDWYLRLTLLQSKQHEKKRSKTILKAVG
jgi:hypothetical protein